MFHVEVTTINPAEDDAADERRESVLHDRLNRVGLPDDMRLGYHVEARGTDSPSLKRLVAEVEPWARHSAEEDRAGKETRRVFEAGGWKIGLRLMPNFRPRPGGQQIAFSLLPLVVIDAAEPAHALTAALDRKATRYGDTDLPFVLVVADRTDRLANVASAFPENVAGGLFGPEIIEDVEHMDGRFETRHLRGDGFWIRGRRANHVNVSAVLAFPRADTWNLREERWQPLLTRNPYAKYPITADIILPWYELVMTEEAGTIRPGRLAGDILDLPDPWPPEH